MKTMLAKKLCILELVLAATCGPANGQTNTFPSSGNVGIGTTSPQAKLYIVAPSDTPGQGLRFESWGAIRNPATGSGALAFDYYNGSSWSNGLLLTTAGNLGIGTVTPSAKLEVSGGPIIVSGDVNPYLMLKSNAPGSPYGFLQYDQSEGNFMRIYDGSQYSMVWKAGNVGIGTSNPGAQLHINGLGAVIGRLTSAHTSYTGLDIENISPGGIEWIVGSGGSANSPAPAGSFFVRDGLSNVTALTVAKTTGNVGIGTTTPNARLTIADTKNTFPLIVVGNNQSNGVALGTGGTGVPSINGYSSSFGATANLALQPNGGNVGIGTTNPTQKLSVNGTIRAKEVIVEASPWPDDVFEESYKLKALSETEAYIKAEGHLPGVPSADTVGEQGVAVGEMQKTLLRKVEELTLYAIEQQEQLRKQAAEIADLRARLDTAQMTK